MKIIYYIYLVYVYVEIRGQLVGIRSLLPLCGCQRSHLSHQVWQQAPFSWATSPAPPNVLFNFHCLSVGSMWVKRTPSHVLLSIPGGEENTPREENTPHMLHFAGLPWVGSHWDKAREEKPPPRAPPICQGDLLRMLAQGFQSFGMCLKLYFLLKMM